MAVLAEVSRPETVVVYAKRRGVEFAMILFAQLLVALAWFSVHLNLYDKLPPNWEIVCGIWFGMGLLAHLVVRWRLPYADPVILPIVFLINGLGLVMIARLAEVKSYRLANASTQFLWTGLAVVVFLATIFIIRDLRRLRGYAYLLFLAGIFLLLMPLFPVIGRGYYGARIWINIAGYSFQPAEVAKIVLTFAFAAYLVEKKEVLALAGKRFLGIDLPRARDLGPIALMWAAAMVVLVFQNDLGMAMLVFGLFTVMIYVATERPSWPIIAGIGFAIGAVLAIKFTSHVQRRISSWLNPFEDYDRNYQIIQGQFGMAWGGLSGRGWGLGRPNITPLAHSDFISAAIAEEVGMVSLMALVVLYGFLVARGLRTALTSNDSFSKLLAVGFSFVIGIQVFAIIGGVTRLLPLTGLTTPFMSQGGSSLLSNWIIVALLMIMSNQARTPALPDPTTRQPVVDLVDDQTRVINL